MTKYRSLAVIWGPAQHQVPDNYEINGIPFVGGRRLLTWLTGLQDEPVSRSAAKETINELEQFRAGTHESQRPRTR